MRSFELGQLAIECTEREVARLPCDLQAQAIGEAHLWPATIKRKSGGDDIAILNREMRVMKKHGG